jgi:hypothetical protein
VPDGGAGIALGQVGVTATDLSLDTGPSEKNRDARGSEGGFNDQLFLANTNTVFALGTVDQQPITDKLAFNGNASFASDRHTIDSEPDARLSKGESSRLLGSVVNENRTYKATVDEHRSAIGDRPIGVSNVDVSADPSTPSGERAITELDILDAERLSFISLQPLPGLIGQQNGLIGVPSPLQCCIRIGPEREPK